MIPIYSTIIYHSQIQNKILELSADVPLKLYSDSKMTLGRYKYFLAKEPETIRWLDRLGEDDILWDVGACVGLYSLYLAHTKKAQVYAFEPMAKNFVVLNENIKINKYEGLIQSYLLGLDEKTHFTKVFLSSDQSGSAQNSLVTATSDSGKAFNAVAEQGVFGVAGDDLISVYGFHQPTAIKIDVDGRELQVLSGMREIILPSPTLQKLSVEIDSTQTEKVDAITHLICSNGFTLIGAFRETTVREWKGSSIRNYHFSR